MKSTFLGAVSVIFIIFGSLFFSIFMAILGCKLTVWIASWFALSTILWVIIGSIILVGIGGVADKLK